MNEMLQTLGENAREAEVILRNLGTAKKNQVLEAVADSLVAHADKLLAANAIDIGEPNFDSLFPRQVNSCDTCHWLMNTS